MSEIIPALLDVLLKATVMLLVAGLVGIPLRRRASSRRLVWALALTGVLALPVLEILAMAHPVATWTVPVAIASAPSCGGLETSGPAVVDRIAPSSGFPVAALTLFIWLAGVAIVLMPILAAVVRLRSLRDSSRAVGDTEPQGMFARQIANTIGVRKWDLRVSQIGLPSSAMTWGWWRPVILLPREAMDWSDRRLRMVLLHEFAHICGRDQVWHLIAAGATSLYWFHPLIWIAARQVRLASEQSADNLVVTGGFRPTDYAQELVAIAGVRRLSRGPASALSIAGGTGLTARVRSILDPANRRAQLRTGPVAGACSLCVGALALACACRLAIVEPPSTAAVGTAEYAVTGAGWPGEYFPGTRLQVMDQRDIDEMNYAQARYAVNEAYARHDVSFRKKPIRDQFLKMSWYEPVPGRYEEASRRLLSNVEGANVDRLERHLIDLRAAGQEMR